MTAPHLNRQGHARAPGLAAALLLGLGLGTVPVIGQEAPAPRTTLDGVYTAEQAVKGKQTYQRVCSACHALDFYGGDVLRAWDGATVFSLFELISTSMPQDNPGSLPRRAYADMLAYILELNDMPPGDEPLPTRRSALNNIRFQWKDQP